MTVGDGYRTIGYDVSDGVATITLDRPEHMNAFTVRMCLEMIDAFDRVDDDPDVRAVIVTGAGRAFCGKTAGQRDFSRAGIGLGH
nr:enoyl-CoA hydratase-related protein [Microthrixaceae bacterium]